MKYTKPENNNGTWEVQSMWEPFTYGRYCIVDLFSKVEALPRYTNYKTVPLGSLDEWVEARQEEKHNQRLIAVAPAMFEKLCELGGLYADVEYWMDELIPEWREVGEEDE